MRDRRPARCTGPWTWPGPSLSARSPTPTESKRLAEKAFSSTVFKGYLCAPDDRELHDIGLLGKRAKVEGEVVDAVDIFVGGQSGPDAKQAIKIMEDVPCSKLPSVLEGLVPYHSRDKLYRANRRRTGGPVRPSVP